MTGFFVTFEGGEATGKSTASVRCAEILGDRALWTREPGGTRLGMDIRSILLDFERAAPNEIAEFLLFQADRAQHVREVISPARSAGRIVLCDRFILSSIAYQIDGRGISESEGLTTIRLATGGLIPDLTILFAVDEEEGARRLRGRNDKPNDRLDNEAIDFHRRVRASFERRYGDASLAHRWARIDTTNTNPEDVAQKASQIIHEAVVTP